MRAATQKPNITTSTRKMKLNADAD